MNLHHRPSLAPPPGTPARCADLAARSLQALAIVDLALEDDGGALSAVEATMRRESLQPLAAAGRRGLVAACSPEVWPGRPRAHRGNGHEGVLPTAGRPAAIGCWNGVCPHGRPIARA